MKTQLAIALSLIYCLALQGQEKVQQQTPTAATTTIVEPKTFKLGDTLKLIVRLTPAPDGYGDGKVTATIVSVPFHQTNPSDWREQTQAAEGVPLLDGVSEYEFLFKISPYWKSGEWKVGWVEFGRFRMKKIDLLDQNGTFKIDTDDPPVTITQFTGPPSVANGTKATFHVVIDKLPSSALFAPSASQGCQNSLAVIFRPVENVPDSAAQNRSIQLQPNTVAYDVPFQLVPDAQPTGKWRAEVISSKVGMGHCPRGVQIRGIKTITFDVLPAANLVVPQTAQVTLNPSEIELLRVQAASLRGKVSSLQRALSAGSVENTQSLLRQSVADALENLKQTEDEYNKEAKEQNRAAHIFFDDLRRQYHDILITFSAHIAPQRSSLRYVTLQVAPIEDVAKAVLATMAHNIDAYETAANAKRWTFTLKLRTEPAGAKISYCRKPDPFVPFDQVTNSEIENLPIAIWFIRFQKDGYKDEELRYDATTETDPIYKKLTKLRGRRAR